MNSQINSADFMEVKHFKDLSTVLFQVPGNDPKIFIIVIRDNKLSKLLFTNSTL